MKSIIYALALAMGVRPAITTRNRSERRGK